MKTLFSDCGATFSPCGLYRPLLWRIWESGKPLYNALMLNPSTAGVDTNDPTVSRQITRALGCGCGGIIVTNLNDLRATDPRDMLRHPEPCSPQNDTAITETALRVHAAGGMIVCGWGNHGNHRGRADAVVSMLAQLGLPLRALRVTKTGEPEHPLYIGYDVKPMPYTRGERNLGNQRRVRKYGV